MSRVKKILGVDDKESDSKDVKGSSIETKRSKKEHLIINTVDIMEENQSLYNTAVKELREKDNHTRVLEILNYFIENDLYLRRIISDDDSSQTFNEVSLKIIIELQSYYNFFRITLLSEVVNYIVLSYNQVKKNLKDYDIAFKWYKYAETINEAYIYDIDMILKKSTKDQGADEHQEKIYAEVVDAFEEVKKIGLQAIQALMRQTLKNVTKPGTLRF